MSAIKFASSRWRLGAVLLTITIVLAACSRTRFLYGFFDNLIASTSLTLYLLIGSSANDYDYW